MSLSDIEYFFPVYPSTNDSDNTQVFPNGFFQTISDLAEFQDIYLEEGEKPYSLEGIEMTPQPHQLHLARYASFNTPYDDHLVFHTMGSGKTLPAIMLCENGFAKGACQKAVIILPSNKSISTFIAEIVRATGTKYLGSADAADRDAATARNVKRRYTFLTIETFGASIDAMLASNPVSRDSRVDAATDGLEQDDAVTPAMFSNAVIDYFEKAFSNTVVIVDEAHNLRLVEGNDTSNKYRAVWGAAHYSKNRKFVLMSGTPMKDRWREFADLMNIVLPIDKQLDIAAFDTTFANDGVNIANEHILREIVRGRVSVVRTKTTDLPVKYAGAPLVEKGIPVVTLPMSDHQDSAYTKWNSEQKYSEQSARSGLLTDQSRAAVFVFPDGGIDGDGYFHPDTGISAKFRKYLFGNDTNASEQDILDRIRECSCKYAYIIESILAHYRSGVGTMIVYNRYVSTVGVTLLGKLLELFGYNSAGGGKRYVALTATTIAKSQEFLQSTIKKFNDPENVNGRNLHVILFSDAASEGLTFKHVQKVIVSTPFWNYATIDQAVARGIRYRSHNDLSRVHGASTVVDVEYLCATSQNGQTSDEKMYIASDEKDRIIKRAEFMLKTCAYDCRANYTTNYRENGVDWSRDCDFQECEYTCDGISDPYSQPNYINRILYADRPTEDEKTIREQLGMENTIVVFDTEGNGLVDVLKGMINNSVLIENKYGRNCFLFEHNDAFFLVDVDDSLAATTADAYYTEYPCVELHTDIEALNDIMSARLQDTLEDRLDELLMEDADGVDPGAIENVFMCMSTVQKEAVLMNLYIKWRVSNEELSVGEFKLIDIYKFLYANIDGNVVLMVNKPSRAEKSYVLFSGSREWKLVDYYAEISKWYTRRLETLRTHEYFVRVHPYDRTVWLVKNTADNNDVSSYKKLRGTACGTGEYRSTALKALIESLDIDSNATTDTDLCATIRRYMIQNELYIVGDKSSIGQYITIAQL